MQYRDVCLRGPVRVLLAALLAFVTGLASAQGAGPLRVGFICPASGGSADFGTSARLGAELAVMEINEVGGFLGRKVELVARDDQGNPERGRQVSEELVLKEKVAFTIGFCNTGVAMKALDVFQDNKHLLMVPVSTGSAVTAKYPAGESYVFRLSPRDTLQAAAIVNDIVERRKLTKVAVFADRTGYGEGGLKDVLRYLAERKLEPVHVARFDLGVTSLASEVQAAKAAGAQVLVGYTVGPEQAVLAKAKAETKFDGQLYGPWPMSFRQVWDRSGGGAEGAVMVQSIIPNLANERRMSFIARLKRQAGKEPVASLMAAAQTYDAVHLMLRALFQTRGDTSAGALKQALENLDKPYVGVITTYERPFSSRDHDAFTMNMIWFGTWRQGEIRYQYAEDEKRAGFIRRKQE
jgi:branched-chain amino acid transport system substrate-binding protein